MEQTTVTPDIAMQKARVHIEREMTYKIGVTLFTDFVWRFGE